jgi:hypothetical protein
MHRDQAFLVTVTYVQTCAVGTQEVGQDQVGPAQDVGFVVVACGEGAFVGVEVGVDIAVVVGGEEVGEAAVAGVE